MSSKDSSLSKPDTDCTDLVDERLPEIMIALESKTQSFDDTLVALLALEKKTRLAADFKNTQRVALAVLKTCLDHDRVDELAKQIETMCNRRAQMKQVVETIVQTGCKFVDRIKDPRKQESLIQTLREVSSGKVFVELERAQLTMKLSQMKESEGNIKKAMEVLLEIQMETVGSMQGKQKAHFVLEQMRLCLANKEWDKGHIISQKIDMKTLKRDNFQEERVRFANLMVELNTATERYLEVAKQLHFKYLTPSVQQDEKEWVPCIQDCAHFAMLAPYNGESAALIQLMLADEKTQELPETRSILTVFTTPRLIKWPLATHKQIQEMKMFAGEPGKTRMTLLQSRTAQHNIRTVAKSFTRCKLARLAQLAGLKDAQEAEDYVADMVIEHGFFARIDRPAGIVSFRKTQAPAVRIQEWSESVNKMLSLLEKTCHIIEKENMVAEVHKAKQRAERKSRR